MTTAPGTTGTTYDAIVIGGGFYGARLALALRRHGHAVLLLESGSQLLGRASLVNQARVHGGYHYPRSILTSLRSRRNYARFIDDYRECIVDDFTHYYAIARGASKVTAAQFVEFCRRIGAPVSDAAPVIARLFDETRIENVFQVDECAFDATRLRTRLSADLAAAGVTVELNAWVNRIDRVPDLTVRWSTRSASAPLVLNCTYAALNSVLSAAECVPIPIKRELTEMALVTPPAALRGAAVTVMDGPFFSLMPYPARAPLSTLSHVRYTPHAEWHDDDERVVNPETSRFAHMVRDAARFLPAMSETTYVDSLWEVKALMPRSEQDDSRPILFRECEEVPGLYSVLGAKIDSVYDVEASLMAVLNDKCSTRGSRGYPFASLRTT